MSAVEAIVTRHEGNCVLTDIKVNGESIADRIAVGTAALVISEEFQRVTLTLFPDAVTVVEDPTPTPPASSSEENAG